MKMENGAKAVCVFCGHKTIYSVKTATTELVIRGVPFEYLEQHACCSECDNEVYVPKINDANAKLRELEYRRASAQRITPKTTRILQERR